MATEILSHNLPDLHFTNYLKKRDAMVARAVTFRLRKRFYFSERSNKVFYALCSTSSFPPQPSYVSSLDPVIVSASAWVTTYLSTSTLIRSIPSYPPLVGYLDPIDTTSCTRTFKQKVPTDPPPPVLRSKKLAKIKKAPLPTITTTSTSTSTINIPPSSTSINSPSNLSRVQKAESNPAIRNFITGKLCSLHICNSKHRCPKAPPWPPSCVICRKQCKLRARVCNGCGVVLCLDDSYAGTCPHPDL